MKKSWLSRKLAVVAGALLLVTGMTLVAAWLPALVPTLSTFYGAILGLVGLYLTGNVAQAHVDSKAAQPPV